MANRERARKVLAHFESRSNFNSAKHWEEVPGSQGWEHRANSIPAYVVEAFGWERWKVYGDPDLVRHWQTDRRGSIKTIAARILQLPKAEAEKCFCAFPFRRRDGTLIQPTRAEALRLLKCLTTRPDYGVIWTPVRDDTNLDLPF